MACAIRNLSALNYANGFTMFHYKTSDTFAEVQAEGYFSPISDMLALQDVIVVGARDGVAFFKVVDRDGNVAPVDVPRVVKVPHQRLAA